MFRSCQIIIRELCSLLKLYYSIHNQFLFANEVLWQHIMLCCGAVARCASYDAHLATEVILQYSQFNSYLQTRCCGSISCCVGMCCGAVTRCASYVAHLATAPQHNMICCHNTSFMWECVVEQWLGVHRTTHT